jgi:hypothetical protein
MPEWITKYWLEWAFGIVIAVLTYVLKTLSGRVKRQQLENAALRDGMRSLLKAQIIQSCERALGDGWCGSRMRDTINDMYASYHALGGNGTVTSIVEQTMRLPAVEPEQHDA